MRTFEFNDSGDWTLGMVEGIDEVAQAVEHNLRIRLGEWFLNETVGMDREPFQRKNFDEREIVAEVTRTILDEERVNEVTEVNVSYEPRERYMTINFTANTTEGVIQREIYRQYGI